MVDKENSRKDRVSKYWRKFKWDYIRVYTRFRRATNITTKHFNIYPNGKICIKHDVCALLQKYGTNFVYKQTVS